MHTKWEILEARRDELAKQLDKANRELQGLTDTPCQLHCAGCGVYLATEEDFARHFLIPDVRYLNLGRCPDKVRLEQA